MSHLSNVFRTWIVDNDDNFRIYLVKSKTKILAYPLHVILVRVISNSATNLSVGNTLLKVFKRHVLGLNTKQGQYSMLITRPLTANQRPVC